MRALLVMMAVLLLMAPAGVLAQDAGGNQTAGNETAGNQTASDGGTAGDNTTEPQQTESGAANTSGQAPSSGGDRPVPEEPLEGPTTMTVDVYLGEAGADLVIHPADITIGPNTQVTFHVVNVGQTDHDFTLLQLQNSDAEFDEEDLREREDGGEAVKTPLLGAGEAYDLTVTFPSEFAGSIVYICSVPGHRSGGMEGTLHVGAAAGGEEEITELGVDYLAYWVGIASFVIIFIVLFGTFFYFRYGESKEVTDHRTGAKTVTAAAASVDADAVEEEGGFLPDPSKVAILLSLIAIGLWALTEFTNIFGGA